MKGLDPCAWAFALLMAGSLSVPAFAGGIGWATGPKGPTSERIAFLQARVHRAGNLDRIALKFQPKIIEAWPIAQPLSDAESPAALPEVFYGQPPIEDQTCEPMPQRSKFIYVGGVETSGHPYSVGPLIVYGDDLLPIRHGAKLIHIEPVD